MSLPLKIAFWATVAGQIILLLAFIAVKEDVLRSGTTVLLQTVPIDPRSLLQGDFAILDYEIAELPDWAASRRGDTIYVELFEGADGVWLARQYLMERPGSDRLFIKGTVDSRGRLEFGIDNYFIPEGTGHIIEGATDVEVRVAVSSGGSAVIEELLVDGEPFDPKQPPEPSPRDLPPPPPQPALPPPKP